MVPVDRPTMAVDAWKEPPSMVRDPGFVATKVPALMPVPPVDLTTTVPALVSTTVPLASI